MRQGPVVVVGAGGHAKVVIGALLAAGAPVAGVLDDDPAKRGLSILGVEVLGSTSILATLGPVAVVLGIGDNRTRQALAARLGARWATVVHPAAWVDPSVRIGPGAVVFAGAVIQPDTVLGAHAIVNTRASIDHDCAIADFAHVAPGVSLAGGVTVGEGAFLGIGSAAIPMATIGAWARVGAGAVVIRPVPPGATVVGVPARARQGGGR